MAIRIEVITIVDDARAKIRLSKFKELQFSKKINNIFLTDNYLIDNNLSDKLAKEIAELLVNPVTQKYLISSEFNLINYANFDWAIEISYLPGVTDNIGNTVSEMISDYLNKRDNNQQFVYSSQTTFIEGKITLKEAEKFAETLYNSLIQRAHIKSLKEYKQDRGMGLIAPVVKLTKQQQVSEINLEISDENLANIGKLGIENRDGTRRGPLALDLLNMKTIQKYFRQLKRSPTDIELESLAQTWSEHCKHTIFNSYIDDTSEGLFKKYIKGATELIIKNQPKRRDFCVSVFTDNSGAIEFDKDFLITHKVETHNSPSALDPFGGSITGIVGVNRDTIGFGLGAKPVANFYGFCFADPRINKTLYRQGNAKSPMLSSSRIMNGVIDGVNAGGNQSGIPTLLGFLLFDERYRGKPLVFVGTIGLIPKKIKNQKSYLKKARPGDHIVVVGGKVGKDGIHGATFSSEALDSGSPVSAVQIGDPITQKKLSDAIVKEARNQLLYNSITDNGAGGLSCSVAEMAKESGGYLVELDKVPLKYPGLEPWEIWISESQERMTLAVPKNKLKKFINLMNKRGVEATVIGKFTNSGKCVVRFAGKTIMDLEMQFLHFGLPQKHLITKTSPQKKVREKIILESHLTNHLHLMMQRLNISSFSFISQQFDHLVQSSSVLPPLQGKGRVNSNTSVFRPRLTSQKGVALSYGLYPSYSEINPYNMAASSIDTAIRNIVATGADIEKIALLDNFCWCSSNNPERLGQLKQAVKACYDYATAYQIPFISGKDSMFNDFNGFDSEGKEIKISIPPTLLITSIGIIDNIEQAVSIDYKNPGDLLYLLGETFNELGGSEYYSMHKFEGNMVPKVNAAKNLKLYKSYFKCVKSNLISSAISVERGGLAVALAKTGMAGMLGLEVVFSNSLFSESQGRILVSVARQNQKIFEKLMKGNALELLGKVRHDEKFIVTDNNAKKLINTDVNTLLKYYRKTFLNY